MGVDNSPSPADMGIDARFDAKGKAFDDLSKMKKKKLKERMELGLRTQGIYDFLTVLMDGGELAEELVSNSSDGVVRLYEDTSIDGSPIIHIDDKHRLMIGVVKDHLQSDMREYRRGEDGNLFRVENHELTDDPLYHDLKERLKYAPKLTDKLLGNVVKRKLKNNERRVYR